MPQSTENVGREPTCVAGGAAAGGFGRPVSIYLRAGFRFMVISAIAFWLGGFTFYASVAIPMGVEVLGSHRKVGFITQLVTNWLNVAGVAALAVLLLNVFALRNRHRRWVGYTLVITWVLMAAIEIELIAVHPMMDRLIGMITPTRGATPIRMIVDADRFDAIHRVYLTSTTVQWFIGLLHVWCICLAWEVLGRPAVDPRI